MYKMTSTEAKMTSTEAKMTSTEAKMTSTEAKILWHEIWYKGPIIGVCEYNGEKMIYLRNSQGTYDIRRFKEGGYEKALQHHLEYRAKNGGTRDHDPAYFSMSYRKSASEAVSVTKTFDYYNNGESNILVTLREDQFEWFYPPRCVKVNVEKRDPFVPSEGKDIEYKK